VVVAINGRLLRLEKSPGAEERKQDDSVNSKQRENPRQEAVAQTIQEEMST
tara:strand:+ start:9372 stop:9524 length:153 start_codon:yes stop_codon:yes gene_type:complete